MRKAPTRVLVVATSLVVVAASALRSPLPLSRERCQPSSPTVSLDEGMSPLDDAGPDRGLLHGHILERSGDQRRHEDLLRSCRRDDLLDSDVILYAGPGKTATGHCALDFATGLGRCTLSGGTRTLDGIRARVDVSYLGGVDWAWDGTYRFSKDDD